MAHRSNDLSLKKRYVQIEQKSELLKIARKSINLFSLYFLFLQSKSCDTE